MESDLISCGTDPPSRFRASPRCSKLLDERYQILSALGDRSGFGIVYAVRDTTDGTKKAVKVIGYADSSTDELNVACTLSEYREFLPAFPEIYGWIPCSTPPREWIELRFPPFSAVPYWEAGELLYYVMEFLDGKVVDLAKTTLDEEGILGLMFELFYSLLFAKVQLGLVHGDIKGDNVMYKIVTEPRTYTVGAQHYMVTSNYLPKIIDPGLARLEPSFFDEDLEALLVVLVELINASSAEVDYLSEHLPEFQTRLDVPISELNPEYILQSSLFNPLLSSATLVPTIPSL